MKVVRMFTGDDNCTHFEEVPLTFRSQTEKADIASLLQVEEGAWLRASDGTMPDFHTAPRRQYLVLLEGRIEAVSTTGERRHLDAGDILVAEDTTGEGHIIVMEGCSNWTALFVPIKG